MYKYLFGPVPSRRLGMSLGIDLVPHKVCSLNCIYCECGATTNKTITRSEYSPVNKIITELNNYLTENTAPDFITFSGAGEPTLNTGIGEIIKYIKSAYPEIPVAVLTNGTLLCNPQVRKELMPADLVLPSLDAANEKTFRKINLPHKSININTYIQGIIDFRKEYSGKIYLEVFILPEYNNHPKELDKIKAAVLKINPDLVQLNTLDRPGMLENLHAASQMELQQIIDYWNLKNVIAVGTAPVRKKTKSYRKDIETAIMETVSRRPCTLVDLSQMLGKHINEVNKYLNVLEFEKRITSEKQSRGLFYKIPKKSTT